MTVSLKTLNAAFDKIVAGNLNATLLFAMMEDRMTPQEIEIASEAMDLWNEAVDSVLIEELNGDREVMEMLLKIEI